MVRSVCCTCNEVFLHSWGKVDACLRVLCLCREQRSWYYAGPPCSCVSQANEQNPTSGRCATRLRPETLIVCSWRSVDMKGTFEAKGVANAKSRLQFVAAEVRKMHAYRWAYVRSMYISTSEKQPPELHYQPLSACVRSMVTNFSAM